MHLQPRKHSVRCGYNVRPEKIDESSCRYLTRASGGRRGAGSVGESLLKASIIALSALLVAVVEQG